MVQGKILWSLERVVTASTNNFGIFLAFRLPLMT